jgi:hypothetical protein
MELRRLVPPFTGRATRPTQAPLSPSSPHSLNPLLPQSLLPMSTISSRFDTVSRPATPVVSDAPSDAFAGRLSELYGLSQKSHYVFGSPLGPFFHQGRHLHLPRFVYFGPHTHDESLRLAFLAGFDATDLRSSLALAHLVERLAITPDLGQGLNLSFFPLVDVLGLARGTPARHLPDASWRGTRAPEIDLLEKDARVRGYHGYVRLETTSTDDVVSVRLRNEAGGSPAASGIELVSSLDFEPWPVRWEADPLERRVADGPLSVADDLPLRPFELTIRLPQAWSAELVREASNTILKRFIIRHRALQAYSQHL